MRFVPLAAAILAGVLLPAAAPAIDPPATEGALTLRLRDLPLTHVLYSLFEMTGQGYVVDGDIAGRVDVELLDVTPADVERDLERLGLAFSAPGPLRRVTAGGEPRTPRPTGAGQPVPLVGLRPLDMRDFLGLLADILGEVIVAPPGPLGRIILFHNDVPIDDVMNMVLASGGLEARREGGQVRVVRRTDPDAVLVPVSAVGRHAGHVASREGEAPMLRSGGIAAFALKDVRLQGIMGAGEKWFAMVAAEDGRSMLARAGDLFYDGRLESIGRDGMVVRLESGESVEVRLSDAASGMTLRAEDASVALDRAAARLGAAEFDEAEAILRAALDRPNPPDDRGKLRAALGDLHYQWGQSLFARGAFQEAVRRFEEAHDIDAADRPWQAAEDLNEIGFAWTELGEPERAVVPHQRALELSRSAPVRNEPRAFTCGRTHDRSPFLEAAALSGLANAEHLRGRHADAARFYGQALVQWRRVEDAFGQSAALTGLGLVEHARGRHRDALARHQKALALNPVEPSARAAILNNLGRAQLALHRPDDAGASFEAALALYRHVHSRAGEGTVLNNLGALWEARSDLPRACAAYEQAAAASRVADDRRGTAITVGHLQRLVARGRLGDDALAGCRTALAGGSPTP